MFDKKFEDRVLYWRNFRNTLEQSSDPITATIKFWNCAPLASRNLDPYDQLTWPDPWEMIEENCYCEFTKILAIAYTLKMIDRYKDWQPIIKIGLDRKESILYYMLFIEDEVVGIEYDKSVNIKDLPKNIHIEKIYMLDWSY